MKIPEVKSDQNQSSISRTVGAINPLAAVSNSLGLARPPAPKTAATARLKPRSKPPASLRVNKSAKTPGQRQRLRPETRAQMLERLTNPLISLHEASVILRVCPATVRRYTDAGILMCVRTEGRQRRFYLRDVLALMRQLESKRR